jgi:hypothetical protein
MKNLFLAIALRTTPRKHKSNSHKKPMKTLVLAALFALPQGNTAQFTSKNNGNRFLAASSYAMMMIDD